MVPVSMPPQRSPLAPVQDDRSPELNAVSTEARDEAEMPLPSNPQTFFLAGLFALAALVTLYVASAIILPSCSPSC